MLNKSVGKLQGYEYPDPSIERGQTPPSHRTPKPLSKESVEKLRDSVREQVVSKTLKK